MNANPTFAKVACYADAAWSLISTVYTVGLVSIVLYWVVCQNDAYVTNNIPSVMYSRPGALAHIESGLALNTNQRIEYNLHLINDRDLIVHTYSGTVESQDTPTTFKDVNINIPNYIPSGSYRLMANISYPQNPIKVTTLELEMAIIIIQ